MFGSMPSNFFICILNKLVIKNVIQSNIIDDSNKSNKLSLKALSGYKLGDLQTIAKDNNISITSEVNGKTKNKTKQQLYNELVSL